MRDDDALGQEDLILKKLPKEPVKRKRAKLGILGYEFKLISFLNVLHFYHK